MVFTVTRDNPTFTVSLKSNPSTGYMWVVSSYPKDVMEVVSKTFEPSKTNLIGAPGVQKFVFKVKDEGFKNNPYTVTVRLQYERPWETGKPPAKVEDIQVNIQ